MWEIRSLKTLEVDADQTAAARLAELADGSVTPRGVDPSLGQEEPAVGLNPNDGGVSPAASPRTYRGSALSEAHLARFGSLPVARPMDGVVSPLDTVVRQLRRRVATALTAQPIVARAVTSVARLPVLLGLEDETVVGAWGRSSERSFAERLLLADEVLASPAGGRIVEQAGEAVVRALAYFGETDFHRLYQKATTTRQKLLILRLRQEAQRQGRHGSE